MPPRGSKKPWQVSIKEPKIKDLIQNMARGRFAVIGDFMLDSYIYGIHERMSPEAPVPVVDVELREERLGGAGNVAVNLRGLGADVEVFSVIGVDDAGDKLVNRLSERGIVYGHIIRSERRRTTIKHRVIANDHHLLRVDEEQTDEIEASLESQLIESLREAMDERGFDALIFQDYNKGVLTHKVISNCIEIAQNAKVFTAVDPKFKHFMDYQEVDLFKPNLKECLGGLDWKGGSESAEQLMSMAKELRGALNCQNLMLTLSERGMLSLNAEQSDITPAMERNIIDVSGAGDTVLAVGSAAMAVGASLKDAAYLANMAGGLVCEHVGVVPISSEMLLAEVG